MELQADAMNRHPFFQERFDKIIHGSGFEVDIFHAVIVQIELRIRVGLMRKAERLFDICFAERLLPDRAAQVRAIQRLIHHIPGVQAAFVMADDLLNMVFQNCRKFLFAPGLRGEPFWVLAMPDECMPAHLHAVLLGKFH